MKVAVCIAASLVTLAVASTALADPAFTLGKPSVLRGCGMIWPTTS